MHEMMMNLEELALEWKSFSMSKKKKKVKIEEGLVSKKETKSYVCWEMKSL